MIQTTHDHPDTVTSALRPQELEAVYAISKAVAQAEDLEEALDQIIKLTRPVLIFDNIVVYLVKDELLEPAYARVVGRGRTSSGDLAWGEAIANQAFSANKTLTSQEKLADWEKNRLHLRYLLGLPLRTREGVLGALVFGRFGGPPYGPDQVHLAEFVCSHIGQLLVRQELVKRIASLEAERRLRQLQDSFVATVSHELCTPLGYIKGYATTLLREDISWDEPTRREFLGIIDEESDRLRELIDNLLDSSRLQSGSLRMQVQQVRMDSLLQEIAQRALSRYKNLFIHLDLQEKVILQADPVRLTQVFDNLISNAVKYAPDSPIWILFQPVEPSDPHQPARWLIQFRDQGPGIAPEHLAHMFERFYRVPDSVNQVHGTGLGLYICREIIRAHDGDIQIESTVGEGTTFSIYLPDKQGKSE